MKFLGVASISIAATIVTLGFYGGHSVDPSAQASDRTFDVDPWGEQYRVCVDGPWPTEIDARRRSNACSQVLQSSHLRLDQIALARLVRGVARTMLGNVIASADDYLAALRHYDSIIDPRAPDALDVYRRAVAEQGLGKTEEAITDYGTAIRLDPKNALAYLGRGTVLASRQRNYLRAVDDFNRTLQIAPTNVTALIARGEAWSQLGEFGRALDDLNRAVDLAPGSARARLMRGLVYARKGDSNLALLNYDAAISMDPRNSFALSNRAAVYLIEKKYEPAIRDLDAAIEVDRKNPLAFYNRGYARFSLGKYKEAIADYEAALRLDPDMGLSHLNICLTRVIAGLAGKNDLEDCDAALRLMPLNLEVRETRGFIFLKLGEAEKATIEYQAVLSVDPNRPLALYGQGLALYRLGNTVDGEHYKAAAIAISPNIAMQFARFGVS